MPPMITKIVREALAGANSTITGVEKECNDKDGEDYIIYQIKLKQYTSNLSKLINSLKTCFSEIIRKCSSGMEQALEGE